MVNFQWDFMYVMASPGLALRDGISGWNPGCFPVHAVVYLGGEEGEEIPKDYI